MPHNLQQDLYAKIYIRSGWAAFLLRSSMRSSLLALSACYVFLSITVSNERCSTTEGCKTWIRSKSSLGKSAASEEPSEIMARMSTSVLVLALASVAAAQTSILNSNSKANATYAAYNGYNATGFMDTSAYYGPYLAVNATTTEGTKPNVSISVQPEGCTILSRQFGIANYSGDLPCTLPGTPASDAKPACVVRALDALCKKVQVFVLVLVLLVSGEMSGIAVPAWPALPVWRCGAEAAQAHL
jgi:hypothetical protein